MKFDEFNRRVSSFLKATRNSEGKYKYVTL
jgi:hypothetical protein